MDSSIGAHMFVNLTYAKRNVFFRGDLVIAQPLLISYCLLEEHTRNFRFQIVN